MNPDQKELFEKIEKVIYDNSNVGEIYLTSVMADDLYKLFINESIKKHEKVIDQINELLTNSKDEKMKLDILKILENNL